MAFIRKVVEPVRGGAPARVTIGEATYLHYDSTVSEPQAEKVETKAERDVGRNAFVVRFEPSIDHGIGLDDNYGVYVKAPPPEERPAGIPDFF